MKRIWHIVLVIVACALLFLGAAQAGASPRSGRAAPSITSLLPAQGPVGTFVVIGGSGFGAASEFTSVLFNGVNASPLTWQDTVITTTVPLGATSGFVTVVTPSGMSNAIYFTVTGSLGSTWYLAEGTTDWGFDTYVTIENPNGVGANADITYMTPWGAFSGGTVYMPPLSQATINPRDTLGNKDFSTRISCREGRTICVDRTMTWTGTGAPSPEAHTSVGVTSPATTWYLPEGSSMWGFECWLLIQNPNDRNATCTITYMIEGEGPRTFTKTVGANTRQSYNMAADIGSKDASIQVTSDVPVIPERAMYRYDRREGHDSIGTISTAYDYYLAEGTSDWGFTTYVLVQNPNPATCDVTVTYMTTAGPAPQAPFRMAANSRKTINVNEVLADTDFSTKVSGTLPIIAERAMYWGKGTALGEACHDSIGVAAPHVAWYLPDGQTSQGRETYTLVQNPGTGPVKISISYLTPSGTNDQTLSDTIPANSRKTYNMVDKISSSRAAIMVSADNAIIVERAMYWNSRGAGTDTIGGHSEWGM